MPLALDTTAAATAFRGIIDLLKADAKLAPVVTTWTEAKGVPGEWKAPTRTEMPAVRLAGTPGAVRRVSTRTVIHPLIVSVEVYIEGTDRTDLLNLWGAIAEVLIPREAVRLLALRGVVAGSSGVVPHTLDVATSEVQPGQESDAWQRLAGTVQIDIYLRA